MEYPEPGYSWHYYVIRDYLTGMPEDNTNHIIQPITANRDERVKGIFTYTHMTGGGTI